MTLKVEEMLDIKGRTCLITGASGHVGQALTFAFAEMDCNLILLDHPNSNLSEFKNKLTEKFQNKVFSISCDLESSKDIEKIGPFIEDRFNSLDILINNAAFVGSSNLEGWATSLENQSLDTWRRAIEVNLTASFQIIQNNKKLLEKSSNASIINVGSIYGIYGPDLSIYENTKLNNPAAYSVSKAGLLQLTRWMSTVLAPKIRVNSISPGGIFRNQPEEFVKRYVEKTPLKRMGSESDIVGAAIYLSTNLSSWVTGQNIIVDGGWGIW